MTAITFMATTWQSGIDAMAYGVPPVILLLAILRNLWKSRRSAVLLYSLALAGWLLHLAIIWRSIEEAKEPFPAIPPGITPPARSSFPSALVANLDGRTVLQLQAPGEFIWKLRGHERAVRFTYGFNPTAYLDGTTNGAGFTLRLREGEIVREIFHHKLEPRAKAADRGAQHAAIILPPVMPGAQLELAVDSGDFNDSAWDWVYLANLDFERSARFTAAQFPLYARLPDSATAPVASLFQLNGHPSFLQLHAPAQLVYRLGGSEKNLRFTYGFLAGAYQNGNLTDGARFLVLLEGPDGVSLPLLDRLLDPLKQIADRGPQPAVLALPDFSPGTRLVLKIEPGPNGNNSWDWTYISRVALD